MRGLLRREPTLDIARVQDAGLRGATDPQILAWAAQERRVLITHDAKTMPSHAYERVAAGQPVAGVIIIPWALPVSRVIDDLVLILAATEPDEWAGRIEYLPL